MRFIQSSLWLTIILIPAMSFPQKSDVALTVYNNNLALVKEVRKIELQKGTTDIEFTDVAAQIDPTSVFFSSLTSPDDVAILEQNYEYDLVNSSKILQKYVDRQITVATKEETTYTGTLLNAAGGDVVLQQSDGGIKIVNMKSVENMAFPKLPEGLITRPTLVWKVDSDNAGDHDVEVGYLTGGIQWHAEYVAVTDKDDTAMELSSWVSIENNSGATYENAKLKLVAGDVHRAQRPRPQFIPMAESARIDKQQFKEKAFFEYHLYTLQRRATVADHQIKQISLFPSTQVDVTKVYSYDGQQDGKDVRVNLEFQNEKAAGLGMPLPQGKIRVYKKDEDASLIFIGEDFIDHTPRDEKVRVYVGNAFDIVGERTQTSQRALSKDTVEEIWEIKLRNHKSEAVSITVIEQLRPNWEILRSSHDYTKKDAHTIEFEIKVGKDAEVIVEYVVRYHR